MFEVRVFTGGTSSAVGAHFVLLESGLFGFDVPMCQWEFREPHGAGGRAGSQFLLPSSLALAAPGCGALGGLGPQDMDFRSPKCSGAWGRVVVHVQEPGSLGILCAPS